MTANFNPDAIQKMIAGLISSMESAFTALKTIDNRLMALEKYLPVIEKLSAGTIAPDGSLTAVLAHEHTYLMSAGGNMICACGAVQSETVKPNA